MVLGPAFLMVAALINIAPIVGIISGSQIAKMYDIDVSDPNVGILMRHRAVLFGLIGGIMMWGVFDQQMFMPAAIIGLVSMFSYLVLTLTAKSYNQALRKVLIADIIGIVAAISAIVACAA